MSVQNTTVAAVGTGTMPVPRILLVRHGKTALNAQDRVRSISDVDLSDEGRRDVMKTARYLREFGVSEIVTSDLTRAEQTAEIIDNQLFVPMESSRKLRDWDMGELIGCLTDDVREDIEFYIENPRKRVPGGETYSEFEQRLREGLRDLISRRGTVIGVTHSKAIELIRSWVRGERDASTLAEASTVPPAGVMALGIKHGKLFEIPLANEHLEKDYA